ncbi:histidine kinase [Flavobacterium sp.]|uniref:sensor histidine kinase n=1 Tax=Flavobacterium sp. TaxID=239 RepID=UPI00286DB882|nr:histidine kinase [Flavobacterium sp.]
MNTDSIHQSEIINVIVYTFLAFVLMTLMLILFFYYSRKKFNKILIQNKDLEISYQKELTRSVLLTQETERKRIAQDLHDDISSKLNIISLNAHLLQTANLDEEEKQKITAIIKDYAKFVAEDSRRIAHDLLPPVLQKFGLHAGIESLCFEINNSKSLNIDYQNEVEFDIKDNDKHLHIFRIIQELINNSIKHGKAKNISIGFTKTGAITTLIYSDNGVGFDIQKMENQKGLGMKNIESRIDFLNAVMTIESSFNKGVVFRIAFPL